MPRWQRYSSHLIFLACALSGTAYFLMHEWHWFGALENAHAFLVAHGVSAYFMLLVFGAVMPGHIRAAWNVRRNRGSGIAMVAFLAGLMVSGLLLYYGPEESRDYSLWGHWVVGGILLLGFPLHLVLGRRANLRLGQRQPVGRHEVVIPHNVRAHQTPAVTPTLH